MTMRAISITPPIATTSPITIVSLGFPVVLGLAVVVGVSDVNGGIADEDGDVVADVVAGGVVVDDV